MYFCTLLTLVPLCFGITITQAAEPIDTNTLLLAKLINAEAGEGCSVEHNQLVGCVVMNRVKDSRFPNTIKGVIYQKGQYSSVNSKKFNQYPSQIAINAAKAVLNSKVGCPTSVIYQANFKQGNGIYKVCRMNTAYYSSTTYFCYG